MIHDDELKTLIELCNQENIEYAITEVWEKGGEGGLDLAKKLVSLSKNKTKSNSSHL